MYCSLRRFELLYKLAARRKLPPRSPLSRTHKTDDKSFPSHARVIMASRKQLPTSPYYLESQESQTENQRLQQQWDAYVDTYHAAENARVDAYSAADNPYLNPYHAADDEDDGNFIPEASAGEDDSDYVDFKAKKSKKARKSKAKAGPSTVAGNPFSGKSLPSTQPKRKAKPSAAVKNSRVASGRVGRPPAATKKRALDVDDDDDDDNHDDDGDDNHGNNDQQRKVRAPRATLMKWTDTDWKHAFLAMVQACGEQRIALPFDKVASALGASVTAAALQQAILKLRVKVIEEGRKIGPLRMSWTSKLFNPLADLPKVRVVAQKKPRGLFKDQEVQCDLTPSSRPEPITASAPSLPAPSAPTATSSKATPFPQPKKSKKRHGSGMSTRQPASSFDFDPETTFNPSLTDFFAQSSTSQLGFNTINTAAAPSHTSNRALPTHRQSTNIPKLAGGIPAAQQSFGHASQTGYYDLTSTPASPGYVANDFFLPTQPYQQPAPGNNGAAFRQPLAAISLPTVPVVPSQGHEFQTPIMGQNQQFSGGSTMPAAMTQGYSPIYQARGRPAPIQREVPVAVDLPADAAAMTGLTAGYIDADSAAGRTGVEGLGGDIVHQMMPDELFGALLVGEGEGETEGGDGGALGGGEVEDMGESGEGGQVEGVMEREEEMVMEEEGGDGEAGYFEEAFASMMSSP
ncbi:hypothetical protein M011DRAFT_234464 [Sporormia fimetaria CBS 119925]|uniref:Uncharacterized protein n=1 Tax=Sporormia fimetaria CBS 119925 TaxID=1340428 RepID=A0A6A6VI26_9PLEO|nr:hypothetical protein M011DRAFT_234464 [Sporormia fimetaria CBS 119925]